MGCKPRDKRPVIQKIKYVKPNSEVSSADFLPAITDAERALFALIFGKLIDQIMEEEVSCHQH